MPARGSQLFDELLAQQAGSTAAFLPFDTESNYRRYVDGKPRVAGVLSFLSSRGINVPMGKPGDPSAQQTVYGLASRKDHYFAELVAREGVQVIATSVTLLRHAHRRGLRLAVASSSHHCKEILQATQLTALFDVLIDGFEIDRLNLRGKPAPDIFLEAARRLHVHPTHAVVFEDATAGVTAARAGGFGLTIGIGQGPHAAELLESGAVHVVADLSKVHLGDRRNRTL